MYGFSSIVSNICVLNAIKVGGKRCSDVGNGSLEQSIFPGPPHHRWCFTNRSPDARDGQ